MNVCMRIHVGYMSVSEYVIYVCMCEHDDVDGGPAVMGGGNDDQNNNQVDTWLLNGTLVTMK